MFEDLFLTERTAQSRASCNLQTEDFRNLNANLQSYVDDIKTIDDDNRQLQEQIERIRTDYIHTLEDHLKRLPNDFRQHSQKLTEAHLDRYRSKSRARRLLAEREETKRRIHFVASDEKEQTKRLNSLQRQERTVRNELMTITEQIENLTDYLQNERLIHRQAMEKVDTLRVHLEHICVDRSKTEFEIQTLREEVKLMQTAKDFLDEERQTILATQTEANDYLLSRLNQTIVRIRRDFDQLNQTQLQQFENDYKQMLQVFEEKLLADHSPSTQSNEYERLQHEQHSVAEELTRLHHHSQTLAERVLAMENDLYVRRTQHHEELLSKNSQLERTKLDLQALNEKLTHFAEDDRNLKFELTLYRGVLEGESRRKQQQKVDVSSALHLIRPTTLSANSNKSITDRTPWSTNTSNSKKSNNQQQEEILTTRSGIQSGDENYVRTDDALSRKSSTNDGKVITGENLWRHFTEPFIPQQQHHDVISSSNSSRSSLPLKTAQSSSSRTSSTSSGVQKSPSSSTSFAAPNDQSISSPIRQLPTTSPILQPISTIKSSDPSTSSHSASSVPSEVDRMPSNSSQLDSTLSEARKVSSSTSSISAETSSKVLNSSVSVTDVTARDSHPASRSSSSSVEDTLSIPRSPAAEDKRALSINISQLPSTAPQQQQSLSRASSVNEDVFPDIQRSPTIPKHETVTSDVQQSPLSRTSSTGSGTSSSAKQVFTAKEDQTTTPADSQSSSKSTQKHEPSSGSSSTSANESSGTKQSSLAEEDQTLSRSSSVSAGVESNVQRSETVQKAPTSISDVQKPSVALSRSSSTNAETSPDIQQSSRPATNSKILDNQPPTSESRPSPLIASPMQPLPSRSSSVDVEASASAKRSSVAEDAPKTAPESSQASSPTSVASSKSSADVQKPFSPAPDPEQQSTEVQKPPTVEIPKTSTDVQQMSSPVVARTYSKPSSTDDINGKKQSIVPTDQADDSLKLSSASSSASQESNQPSLQSKEIETSNLEEQISSSPASKAEENSPTVHTSSKINTDDHSSETNPFFTRNISKQSSHTTSLTDVEEMDFPTSRKFETRSADEFEEDDGTLAAMMQDLRCVFGELANNEELIEINDDLSDKIYDRLEFRDHLIETVFDRLFRKYLVQAAVQGTRSATLDWVEFRDILFPIVSSRYTERHVRKYFELFDTSKDGYLSVQEITEILEILRANETPNLAQNIIEEYDTDHDGKLNADEFVEAIFQVEDIHEHILSDDTENKEWFSQLPIENQTISLEVPVQLEGQFNHGIPLLGRIFRRVGADSNTEQLDIHQKNLPAQITDELRRYNREISSDDLQSFIQLYLNQKQKTASTIGWMEFRNLFLPIVNNGFYSKNDIQRWFDIFDTDSTGLITQEQIIRLLRLLQVKNPDEIMQKFIRITETHTDDAFPWSFDELFVALTNVSATSAYLLTENEQNQQIASFDLEWLSRNIY